MTPFKCMSTRQADRFIASGAPVRVRFPVCGEEGVLVLVSRDRFCVYTACGCKFDRTDMEIVK
jgi:hypothetical protein